ncbi:unnamed protein product, partial [marine sediment metagenome]
PATAAMLSDYKVFTMGAKHGTIVERLMGTYMITYHPSYVVRTHGDKFDKNNLGEYDLKLSNDIIKALDYIDEYKSS